MVPWQPIDACVESVHPAFDAQETAFIPDAPLVLKARSSTHSEGVWFYPDRIGSFVADWQSETAPEPFLLRYAVPDECDRRVIVAGDTPVSGEDRHGSPHTDRSNLNQVETESGTLLGTVAELLNRGAVEPFEMTDLNPAVGRAIEDLHEALAALTGCSPAALQIWIGWDFLVVDPTDERLRAPPEDVRTGLLRERYRTRDGSYLASGEGNLSPGSKSGT